MSSTRQLASSFQYVPLNFVGGFPHSSLYDDCYFQAGLGLEESYYVYLLNKQLATRFTEQSCFTIAEIGFGIGLNFLATLELWAKTTQSNNTLVYVSCERHPMSPEDLGLALKPWHQHLNEYTSALLDAYQSLTPGLNIFVFEPYKVILILLIGDAFEQLKLCDFKADHWMLDGFAPAKNPDAWDDSLLREISRLSAPQSSLATFTSVGAVRRSLQHLGWDVKKIKGFAKKRHAVWAFKQASQKTISPKYSPCLIVGTGIAALSFQFMRSWIASDAALCIDGPWPTKASMVPLAYGHLPVHQDLTPLSLLGLRSHLMSGHFYRQFTKSQGLYYAPAPLMSIAGSKRHKAFQQLASTDLYRRVIKVDDSTMEFPLGYSLEGPALLYAMSLQNTAGISLVNNLSEAITAWQEQHPLGEIFWANSFGFAPRNEVPTPSMIRGQQTALVDQGQLVWQQGTHERYVFNPQPRYIADLHSHKTSTSYESDFVGFRSVLAHYKPHFGALSNREWCSLYHGSRGLSTGLWAGTVLALRSLNLFSYKEDGRFA